jgi:enterochelin esterase-like enzyme
MHPLLNAIARRRRRGVLFPLFLLGALAVPRPAGAQSVISLRDSTTRRIAAHSAESVFVLLRDGDYARLVATHPAGLAMSVIRPSGDRLRPFITPAMKGVTPIEFVAERAGRYAVAVTNDGDSALRYDVVFRERLSLDERTATVPRRDAVPSPRIEAIRRQVDSGNTNTVDFWSAVAKEGTPLVEPLDARYDLVTFLWRAEGDTRNVFLRPSFGIPRAAADFPLYQLGTTDIWYLTVTLPKGARFTYQLEPNRPTVPSMARVTAQMDPLNRGAKLSCVAGASKYRCLSIGELPDAAPQPWLARRPGVAAGRIEKQKIHSALQGVERDLTVYTPAGYAPTGNPAALVVLFDGDIWLRPDWHGPDIWDNLIAAHKVPPMVVVQVHNLPNRRLFDLVANPTFGDFMAKELVPWLRAHYNVSHDPEKTVVGGTSAGGFGAAYLGLAHPKVFGNVLSMSGAFWWSPEHNGGICAGVCADPSGTPAVSNQDATTEPNWIAQLALRQPAARVRFYLAAGTFEFDRFGTAGQILEETRHLRDILLAKNYEVFYHQFVGGHDGASWPGVMADGLQRLLGVAP